MAADHRDAMTCRVAIRRQPEYQVTFRDPYGATCAFLVRAEDSGSATLLGLARLQATLGSDHAEWTWAGTERV